MNSIYDGIPTRIAELEQLIRDKEKAINKAPQGALHIRSHGSYVQYYINTGGSKDKYLARKQDPIAKALAQRRYDERVLSSANKELQALRLLQEKLPAEMAEDIFESMSEDRKKLVTPFALPENVFIDQWQNISYEKKGFMENVPEYYTARGERVRSKSEILIADILYKLNIPYRYEYPVTLRGLGTIYPDFTLLHVRHRKEMYLEHLGMMDDPVYAENALQRISLYEQNGIFPGDQLILLHETSTHPLNVREAERMLRKYML